MIGILLINLGTPASFSESDVRDYLNEFLSDPYVITLPKILRDFLVQKIILPKRPKISAAAYQKIWTENGSPLLLNSVALQNTLQKKMGGGYGIVLGMRYGKPSISHALDILKKNNCEKIIALPLFPQFSNATTQSALDCVNNAMTEKNITVEIKIIHDFYNQDFYIDSLSKIISESWQKNNAEFLLLSYHGLPKRQKDSENYRAQCYETSKLLTEKLNLSAQQYQVSFQSRLGFTKWITPYTDHVIHSLREKNIKKLSVACPSFVADCVETLEEINIRLREQWMQLGGESFELIPCLNTHEYWIEQLSNAIPSVSAGAANTAPH